jgi:hypothetical protein
MQGQDFALFHGIQTDTEAQPASYPVGTEGSFTEVKAAKERS